MSLTRTQYLRKISEEHSIIVPKMSGQRTLAQAGDIFTGHLDSDFKNWNTDVPGEAKPATPADVYEQVEFATFKQMFTSLSSDLDQLLWEQEQIIAFGENHKNWLHPEGCGNFFLFKVGKEFFVAYVYLHVDKKLRALVFRFNYGRLWLKKFKYRVVVPQLKLEN